MAELSLNQLSNRMDNMLNGGLTGVPVGSILPWSSNNIPTGWLECNGQIVNRTTYNLLFAVINTIYGAGDGITTFAVPDLRGVVPRGLDRGRGLDIDGKDRTIGSYQADEFKSHSHNSDKLIASNGLAAGNSYATVISPSSSTGGTETRMKNIAVIYVIKYADIANDEFINTNFNSLKSANGYQKLPGGLILQWVHSDSVIVPNGVITTIKVSLPIAFPNGYLAASATFVDLGIAGITPPYGLVGDKISISTTLYYNGGGNNHATLQFIAIGY